uniref:Uncharacterized protein n=1 Tax=Nelumbo nucifera TaxID=4432 RepID=A0A822ZN61_NELNU|nr:TPA_asm: hypothetical protein HUJ06_002606 [Nelumbo nucifera]
MCMLAGSRLFVSWLECGGGPLVLSGKIFIFAFIVGILLV